MFDEETMIWIWRIIASFLCACFYFVATVKMTGVMQQCGYDNKKFGSWLRQKRNTYVSRLAFWSVLSFSSTALVIFVFFFLGEQAAMAMGGVPFFGFAILFYFVDGKFALKVQTAKTRRWTRLAIGYAFLIAVLAFVLIVLCSFLEILLGMFTFGWICAIRFLPLCFMPLLLPFVLRMANGILSPFERKNNERFIKNAGQVLNETNIIRVGIVGSYGKTSVKNALKTLLSGTYKVVATPASYNTPMGVAKTVFSDEFTGAEVFLCEMGARKAGDIQELCDLVRPDYIIFTGVCAQHIESFGSEENVFRAKCEALASSAKWIVCGKELKERILAKFPAESEKCRFAQDAEDVELRADGASFAVVLEDGSIAVKTSLLGDSAVENVCLAAMLAKELGVSKEDIAERTSQIKAVPHRLELLNENGVFILDDAYNCNIKGAKIALGALRRFGGKKYVITPGIVETGVLQQEVNGELGKELALSALTKVVIIGSMQAKVIIDGYTRAGGDADALKTAPSLEHAVELIKNELNAGDCVLFMNDLPDVV